jgi:hypothetical protein
MLMEGQVKWLTYSPGVPSHVEKVKKYWGSVIRPYSNSAVRHKRGVTSSASLTNANPTASPFSPDPSEASRRTRHSAYLFSNTFLTIYPISAVSSSQGCAEMLTHELRGCFDCIWLFLVYRLSSAALSCVSSSKRKVTYEFQDEPKELWLDVNS